MVKVSKFSLGGKVMDRFLKSQIVSISLGQGYNFASKDFYVTLIIRARKPFHVLYFYIVRNPVIPVLFF